MKGKRVGRVLIGFELGPSLKPLSVSPLPSLSQQVVYIPTTLPNGQVAYVPQYINAAALGGAMGVHATMGGGYAGAAAGGAQQQQQQQQSSPLAPNDRLNQYSRQASLGSGAPASASAAADQAGFFPGGGGGGGGGVSGGGQQYLTNAYAGGGNMPIMGQAQVRGGRLAGWDGRWMNGELAVLGEDSTEAQGRKETRTCVISLLLTPPPPLLIFPSITTPFSTPPAAPHLDHHEV